MDEQRDFTIDPVNYNGLPEYVDTLKSYGMHYIIILVSWQLSISQEIYQHLFMLGGYHSVATPE